MRKLSCAENYDYIKNQKLLLRTQSAPDPADSGLRLCRGRRRRKKGDLGLTFDMAGVVHF
jgi:hypothetical protein